MALSSCTVGTGSHARCNGRHLLLCFLVMSPELQAALLDCLLVLSPSSVVSFAGLVCGAITQQVSQLCSTGCWCHHPALVSAKLNCPLDTSVSAASA